MAGVSSPLQLSREQRRQLLSRHLVPAVEGLLQAGGAYSDVSVEQIITAGGISRSSFYNYFDDKNDLLAAIAGDVIGDMTEAAGAWWWSLPDDVERADVQNALRPALELYRRHQAILGSVVEVATYDHRVRSQQTKLIDAAIEAMARHWERRQATGRLDQDLDPRQAAAWTGWMLERGLYQLVGPADDAEAARLLDTLTELVWRMFYR